MDVQQHHTTTTGLDSDYEAALASVRAAIERFRGGTAAERAALQRELDQLHAMAEKLAADLGVSISEFAAQMFAAKSDVSSFSDAELLRMDSKEYNVAGKELRVGAAEREITLNFRLDEIVG